MFYDISIILKKDLATCPLLQSNVILFDKNNILEEVINSGILKMTTVNYRHPQPDQVVYINLYRFLLALDQNEYWLCFRYFRIVLSHIFTEKRAISKQFPKVHFVPEKKINEFEFARSFQRNLRIQGNIDDLNDHMNTLIEFYKTHISENPVEFIEVCKSIRNLKRLI